MHSIQQQVKVLENTCVAENTWHLRTTSTGHAFQAPGQFANLQIPGYFLRRPISIADWNEGELSFYYRVQGDGTRALSRMVPGQNIDILVNLGNGFTPQSDVRPVLIGGGIGTAPLLGLARRIAAQSPIVILGFQNKQQIFGLEAFQKASTEVHIATDDGSAGTHGFVTDVLQSTSLQQTLQNTVPYIYTCGPMGMLRAVYQLCSMLHYDGQFSLEERMGCGFGDCMGCSIKTANGYQRICKDGPVFTKSQLFWEAKEKMDPSVLKNSAQRMQFPSEATVKTASSEKEVCG